MLFNAMPNTVKAENPLFQALDTDQIEMNNVEYYVNSNKKAPPKLKYSYTVTDYWQRSFLHYAALHSHIEALSILMQAIKDEISGEISHNYSIDKFKQKHPRTEFCKENPKENFNQDDDYAEIINEKINKKYKELLNEKIDAHYKKAINAKDHEGNTPLHLACKQGHVEVAKCLIEAGADIFIRNQKEEEPLIIAINNHTEEELTDAKKLARRIDIIKTLLELDAGIGIKNLHELFENAGIAPRVTAFGVVNVIGTGLTREYPGFEVALCNMQEYLEHLYSHPEFDKSTLRFKTGVQNMLSRELYDGQGKLSIDLCRNKFGEFASLALPALFNSQINLIRNWRNIFDRQCQLRIELCNKRLGQFVSLENIQAVQLVDFIKQLDFLKSGHLQRLCDRVIAATMSNMNQEEQANYVNALPDETRKRILPASTLALQSGNINAVRALLSDLQSLNTNLENSPTLIHENLNFRTAHSIRNMSLSISYILFFVGILYYAISDSKDRSWDSWDSWDRGEPWILIDIILSAIALSVNVLTIPLILVLINDFSLSRMLNSIQQFYVPDSSNFALRLTYLNDTALQTQLSDIVGKIKILKANKLISDNTADTLINATNVVTLKSAIADIIEESQHYIKDYSKEATIFFTGKPKAGFFQPAPVDSDTRRSDSKSPLIISYSSESDDDEENYNHDHIIVPLSSDESDSDSDGEDKPLLSVVIGK